MIDYKVTTEEQTVLEKMAVKLVLPNGDTYYYMPCMYYKPALGIIELMPTHKISDTIKTILQNMADAVNHENV